MSDDEVRPAGGFREVQSYVVPDDHRHFIVAEVSKNWKGREPHIPGTKLIAMLFEDCIAYNLERGYKLHSFTLNRLICGPDEMNETIIAVFERKDDAEG